MGFMLIMILFTGMKKECLPQQSEMFMYELMKHEKYDSVLDQIILDENFDYDRSAMFNNDLVICDARSKSER